MVQFYIVILKKTGCLWGKALDRNIDIHSQYFDEMQRTVLVRGLHIVQQCWYINPAKKITDRE